MNTGLKETKIAILSFYSGYVDRGVEVWTHELSKRLANEFDISVFQAGPVRKNASYKELVFSTSNRLQSDSILNRIWFDRQSLSIAVFTLKLLKSLWKLNPDIIISTNGGWQVAFVRIFSWITSAKMVVVGHSGPGRDEANNLWSFPDIFVALTHSTLHWANKINPFVRKTVIGDGVDLKVFTPVGKKASINLTKPIFLAVGALALGKRLELAIDAVAQTKQGSLLILGDGPLEKHLTDYGKKKLGKRFLLTSVPHKDIADYYRAVDVFTLPSWSNEAFGMVYLEAMASGLPVVATNDENRVEIVGDAGMFVDPTDTATYSKSLSNASKVKISPMSRKQAEKYSWENVANQYRKLFKEITK